MRTLLVGTALMLATPALAAGPRDSIDTFQDGIELKSDFQQWGLAALFGYFGIDVPRVGVLLGGPDPDVTPGGVNY